MRTSSVTGKSLALIALVLMLFLTGRLYPTSAQGGDAWLPASLDVITAANAGQITQLARWGQGGIGNLAWVDDTILVTNWNGIWQYDANGLDAPPDFLEVGQIGVTSFIPNRDIFASVRSYEEITLRVMATGETRLVLDDSPSGLGRLALNPRGTWLAVVENSVIRLWEIGGNAALLAAEEQPPLEPDSETNCLAFHPNGMILATGHKDGRILLWDVQTGEQQAVLEGHTDSVTDLVFHPDGVHLISNSADGTVQLWDVPGGEQLDVLTPAFNVHAMALAPGGDMLAMSGGGRVQLFSIHLEDVPAFWVEVLLQGDRGSTLAPIAFSPDGTRLIGADEAQNIYVWDTATGERQATLEDFTGPTAVDFSPDGSLLTVSGDYTLAGANTVHVLDMSTGEVRSVFEGASIAPIQGLAFSPDGAILAAGSNRGAELWDINTGRRLATRGSSLFTAHSMAFDPEGATLALADGWERQVELWHISGEGESVAVEEGIVLDDVGSLESVAFSPDGTRVVIGSEENLRVRNASDGQELALWEDAQNVLDMAFSPDGTTLATVNYLGGSVQLWNFETGVLRTEMDAPERVYTVTFNLDGTLVAAGYRDGTIRLWDPRSGTGIATLQGHHNAVRRITFSPDGAIMASASDDGTVRLWGVPGND